MNVIKIYGGLGNQLFQYAFGKTLEAYGGTVAYDVSWYLNKDLQYPRPYRLGKFNTNLSGSCLLKQSTIKEDGFMTSFQISNSYNYIGYWQSPKYHEKTYKLLQSEFCVKEELYTQSFLELKEKINNTMSISVHVRHGDFLSHKSHYVVPLCYYEKALNVIRVLQKDIEIFVFSDDLKWCKQNFNMKKTTFVHLPDYLEFELMKLCKFKVIANSTFSWWPAYLGSGMVITPQQWWVIEENNKLMNEKGLLLNNWIKL